MMMMMWLAGVRAAGSQDPGSACGRQIQRRVVLNVRML